MIQQVSICLWFDTQAKEAAEFYSTVFNDFSKISENPLAVNYSLFGQRFMNMNGGPGYPINPAISFFVNLDTEEEIITVWEKLTAEGNILMPLDTYPWSEKYGWCADKFGVNWQLMLTTKSTATIVPSLMFNQQNSGKAEEAINFYTGVFPNASIGNISRYEKGEPDIEGNIKYAEFKLNNTSFAAADSSMPHAFFFNEGVSFMLVVDTQEEIDYYWNHLVAEGKPGRCGWLKDKYGVSWQVIPSMLGKLMSNSETAPKAVYAFLQMSKFIIADLEKATS